MSERPTTAEGTPIGGWVLRSADAASIIADLKEFGQVFRFPLPDTPRIDLVEAGQPCFLYVGEPGNPAVKPGIWAVGEVVGPVTEGLLEESDSSADDGVGSAGEQRLFAEVELIPLKQRITLGELNDDRVLVDSELIDRPDAPNPLVLRPEEVRALEAWDFDLVEPTPEQMARLDEVLDEDDAGLILTIIGVERSVGIVDDGTDGLLSVVLVGDSDAKEAGRYSDLADALESVAHHAESLTFAEAPDSPTSQDGPPGDPMGLIRAADGDLSLHLVPDGIALWDLTEPAEHLATFASLPDALAGIAEAVVEVTEDPPGA